MGDGTVGWGGGGAGEGVHGSGGGASVIWEPPLWSRRILRGNRSEMRSIVIDRDRRLWCGTRALRIYQVLLMCC
jgi:hypothetical protein